MKSVRSKPKLKWKNKEYVVDRNEEVGFFVVLKNNGSELSFNKY